MSGDAFVDTNVWLYALVVKPGEETKHDRAKQLIADLSRCTVSTQVIAEVSVNLLKKAGMREPDLIEIVEDFYASHRVQDTGLGCHRRASDLRSRFALSFWDSLVLAAAREAGCSVFYSEDMQHGLRIDNRLRIVNPFTPAEPNG
jgi:predicted nucleic acid-binding protein